MEGCFANELVWELCFVKLNNQLQYLMSYENNAISLLLSGNAIVITKTNIMISKINMALIHRSPPHCWLWTGAREDESYLAKVAIFTCPQMALRVTNRKFWDHFYKSNNPQNWWNCLLNFLDRTKGSRPLPKGMNFRKSSKRHLTPPSFSESYAANFFRNSWPKYRL